VNDDEVPKAEAPDRQRALIDGLTGGDWQRLTLFARRLASALPGVGEQDLLQEAIVATLSGRRRCPPQTDPRVFLMGVMRSCLSNWKKKASWTVSLESLNDVPDEPDAETPEHWVGWRQDIELRSQALVRAFDGDDQVLMLIEAKVDGLARAEIVELLGCTLTQLESMERRLRRFMARPADEEPTA